jgi:hypothetical protein
LRQFAIIALFSLEIQEPIFNETLQILKTLLDLTGDFNGLDVQINATITALGTAAAALG